MGKKQMTGTKSLNLMDLIERLKSESLLICYDNIDENSIISSITYNSKAAKENCLFICKGIHFEESYLAEAINNGASAYLAEKPYSVSAASIIVKDVRKALAVTSAAYYDYDPAKINISAVTGTKGKSTTVYYLKNILSEAKRKTAYATTVEIFDGKEKKEAVLTTPESDMLHYLINSAVKNKCSDIIIEVSSQAEKMSRIYNLEFNTGIYLNISNDHISPNEHKDFNEYLSCKMAVVSKYKNAVLNMDDKHFNDALAAAENAERTVTYSYQNHNANFYACDIKRDGFITRFSIATPYGIVKTHTVIPGEFNVSNAVAAAAAAYLNGVSDVDAVSKGISETKVAGRMDIFAKGSFTVIVDYAHNKTSLEYALSAVKQYYPSKNIKLAFGCPGGKGLQRRRDMAYVASQYASYVYVTSEDPSCEDPYEIALEVSGYLNEYGCKNEIVTDRKKAVKKSIAELSKDDILIIAGKGDEHYQIINGKTVEYEGDTALARMYVNKLI